MARLSLPLALRWFLLGITAVWLTGCATSTAPGKDYSAFRAANPQSILVLPPLNDSPDVQATASVLSYTTVPLAEAGYYVMPVTLVTETFRQNGLEIASDIHEVAPAKLHEIFGADTALYIKVDKYGVSYQVINSVAVVSVEARLVDLRTGTKLWTGQAYASSDEGGNNSGGGLVGMLVTALIKQIVNSVSDVSHPVAGVATNRLLAVGGRDGLLYGPRSPKYLKN